MNIIKSSLKPLLRLTRSIGWRWEKDIEIGNLFSVPTSSSGIAVTPDSAMRSSTVYSCVRVLSEDVGSTPCILYRRVTEDSRKRATDHPLYNLLHDLPNQDMTAKNFWELMMWYKLLRGVAFAKIDLLNDGTISALKPLNPDKVRVLPASVSSNGQLGVEYYDEQNKKQLYRFDELFKLFGPFGMSVISFARESIGLQLAQQSYAGSFFSNYAAPRGVVEFKDSLGEDVTAIERWKKHFIETYSSPNSGWGVAVLENGAQFKPISMTHQDAEFVEARKMSREDICGCLRVPPYKIGDYSHATFSNVEEVGQQYLSESLLSHYVDIRQAVYRDLLTEKERKKYYVDFLTDNFNKGNTEKRYAAYAQGRQHGFLSVNDIRRKENMNPVEGGDVYLVQPGYIPADMLEDWVKSQMAGKDTQNDGQRAEDKIPRVEVNVLNEQNRQLVSKFIKLGRDANGHIEARMTEKLETDNADLHRDSSIL